MDGYYLYPSVVDASSPDSISPPASVCASSTDFPYTYDAPSPEFKSEFDALHSQSLGSSHAQVQEDHSTSPSRPNPQGIRYHQNGPRSTSPNPGSSTDFEFMNTLLSIHGTRDQNGSDYGGEVAERPSGSEAAVAETIVRARKSWKTVKGRSEPVWPPHLEKALVQALLQYKPHDSRYARALGRFPKRNRYISDYIFDMTGVRRTPKQVGSRLQQLKDVSCGKMLLNHVASWALQSSPKQTSTNNDTSVSPSSLHPDLGVLLNDMHGHDSGSSSPVSPLAAGGPGARQASSSTGSEAKSYNFHSTLYPSTHGAITSSPFDSPPVTPVIRKMDVYVPFNHAHNAADASNGRRGAERGRPLVHFSGCLARPETVIAPEPVDPGHASPWIEPRATFTSRDPIAARSVARVWVDNTTHASTSPSYGVTQGRVKSEQPGTVQAHQYGEPLVCMQTPAARASAAQTSFYSTDNATRKKDDGEDRECFVYATRLVDEPVWCAMRREGLGLRRYTITQELMHSFDSPTTRRGEVFLAITYHFVPISSSICGMNSTSHSMLSPLETRGHGYGHSHGRGSVSPASSGTPSPISASPSFLGTASNWHSNSAGHGNVYGMMHNVQAYAHPQPHMRGQQVSPQAHVPSISQSGTLMNTFGQGGCLNSTMTSATFSDFDTDFNGIDINGLHLSTSPTVGPGFHQPQPFR